MCPNNNDAFEIEHGLEFESVRVECISFKIFVESSLIASVRP